MGVRAVHKDRESKGAPRTPSCDDPRLQKIFGEPVPMKELEIWTRMPQAQRAKALQRISALDRFSSGDGEITAEAAAADAGVTLSRFYQIARLWRDQRSLASLGSYAAARRPRQRYKPEITNALQAVVARVVSNNPSASIAGMAQLLAKESGLPENQLPSRNTLRLFIERELRRRAEAGAAGYEVLFDCSATSLFRPDGLAHTIFIIIDAGTRLILGHAVGEVRSSRAGYGAAASNALIRITQLADEGSIWAPRLGRSELVPGDDREAVAKLAAALKNKIGGSAPQLLTSVRPYGRYIRKHLGLKLGPIRLLPARTGRPADASKVADRSFDTIDAHARLELEVAVHNAAVLENLSIDAATGPPDDLMRLLAGMADA